MPFSGLEAFVADMPEDEVMLVYADEGSYDPLLLVLTRQGASARILDRRAFLEDVASACGDAPELGQRAGGSDGGKYGHPFYRAPFVYYGRWLPFTPIPARRIIGSMSSPPRTPRAACGRRARHPARRGR